jgi:hypothetical protein
VKKLTNINGQINLRLCDNVAEINKISLNRLIDGGAAILAQISINHHIDIVGRQINVPRVMHILRV